MPAKPFVLARRARPIAAVWLVGAALVGLPAMHAAQSAPGRMLAIGDIHGSFDGITTILKKAGVIDEGNHWSGGRTVIVQTGDYTDRGPDVKKVMDLLMQLEKEAKAAGGQFLALAGNHEVMNMMGDWRDVSPEACAAFATPQSENKRNEVWQQYERLEQLHRGQWIDRARYRPMDDTGADFEHRYSTAGRFTEHAPLRRAAFARGEKLHCQLRR